MGNAAEHLDAELGQLVAGLGDPDAALRELDRLDWLDDPLLWARERAKVFLWSKQREILLSLRDHRRTSVQACHDVGKSHVTAHAIGWWVDSHPPGEAFVVTSAPTAPQVRAILWRELSRVHARGGLPGRLNQTEWWLTMPDGREELVAFGRKPADTDPSAFQGIHARYVLVVFDEACHDDQTDVLTDAGWKRFADLDGTERLLTMDPATHVATYRHPERLVAKRYTGPMYEYVAKGGNYCVTPDHEMFYHGRTGRKTDTAWRKAPVTSLVGRDNKFMRKTIRWDAPDVAWHEIPAFATPRKSFPGRRVPMDAWLRFLGWYLSEGHLTRARGVLSGIGITQKDPTTRDAIADLCAALGFSPKTHLSCSTPQVCVYNRQLAEHLATLGTSCLTKRVPRYVTEASVRQIKLFLDTFVAGDGYRKGKGEAIYTSSPKMADDLQELVLKTGMPAVVSRRALRGVTTDFGTHRATSTCDGYLVTRPFKSSKLKHYPQNLRVVDYDGMVYCATVPPEHLLFTRRNGYTMWSGNCGIPKSLWDAADSLIANDDSRILVIGNPDDPQTEFAEVCKPGSGWNVIHISAFDSPNFTGEDVPDEIRPLLVGKTWVEEKRRKWGEQNPLWKSKVEGEFPDQTDGGLISPKLILAAQHRRMSLGSPIELGVDVGAGGDKNVIYARWGPVARLVSRDQQPDTMKTLGNVLAKQRETGATAVKIDKNGVGMGAVNRAAELGESTVIGINVGEAAANREEYENLRAEGYDGLLQRFIDEDIDLDPDDLDLAAELVAIRRERSSRGRMKIESKDEMRKRLDGRSPDNADALMLCFLNRGPVTFDAASIISVG